MKSLKATAGFDLYLNEDMSLSFAPVLGNLQPSARKFNDCLYVLANPEAAGPEELYWMYRDLALPEHRKTMQDMGLRYDVTVIRPGKIGDEYIKTIGHYHPRMADSVFTWPEVYEVLHGEATYLLQSPGKTAGTLSDVTVMKVKAGEKAVIPPGYGHVTVNAGPEVLVMANWVSSRFASVYGEIGQLHGGGYYCREQSGNPVWLPNPYYAEVPEIRSLTPVDLPHWGFISGEPMYRLIANDPEKLRLLNEPQNYFLSKED